jgi:acetyltransferase-like isoleucine patch superfamily enzyme
MQIAPIVLFVYNRPWHTEQTLKALWQNDLANESELYIYSDGPKPNASLEQIKKISEVRRLIRKNQYCKNVYIIESEINKGLADSIISGVSEVVNKYGRVIVLEDDIVTMPGFLKFMNEALDIYKNDAQVMQISAYNYPTKSIELSSTLFLRIMACWGWATWDRAWKNYNNNIDDHLKHFNTKKQIKKFDIEGHGNFYWQLLANKSNEIYTWAVKWYASWLYAGGISLFPPKPLIKNIGFDGTGEHCVVNHDMNSSVLINCDVKRVEIAENKKYRLAIDNYFKNRFPSKKKFLIALLKLDSFKTVYSLLKRIQIILSNSVNWNVIRNKSVDSEIDRLAYLQFTYQILNSKIAKYSYIAKNSEIRNTDIGKFCSIGANFISGNEIHPLYGISTSPMFYSNGKQNGTTLHGRNKIEEFLPVTIGNDVFIGDNVIVLSGVTICDGAVIGAGAVVSKDIPPYAIAVGIPIKIMKYRFTEKQIEALLRIHWWDFTDDQLLEIERNFFDVEGFILKYDLPKVIPDPI